jgi:hypothetical protein
MQQAEARKRQEQQFLAALALTSAMATGLEPATTGSTGRVGDSPHPSYFPFFLRFSLCSQTTSGVEYFREFLGLSPVGGVKTGTFL